MTARILCAGIGNAFFGDDGFGCEVATRLCARPVPDGVRVEEYGIRGLHLAYDLLDGYDVLVIVDAMALGAEPPGTVVVLDAEPPAPGPGVLEPHTMTPQVVLRTLADLGGSVERVLVVGCQPATVEEGLGLSEPVAAAVDDAVDLVSDLLDRLVVDLSRMGAR